MADCGRRSFAETERQNAGGRPFQHFSWPRESALLAGAKSTSWCEPGIAGCTALTAPRRSWIDDWCLVPREPEIVVDTATVVGNPTSLAPQDATTSATPAIRTATRWVAIYAPLARSDLSRSHKLSVCRSDGGSRRLRSSDCDLTPSEPPTHRWGKRTMLHSHPSPITRYAPMASATADRADRHLVLGLSCCVAGIGPRGEPRPASCPPRQVWRRACPTFSPTSEPNVRLWGPDMDTVCPGRGPTPTRASARSCRMTFGDFAMRVVSNGAEVDRSIRRPLSTSGSRPNRTSDTLERACCRRRLGNLAPASTVGGAWHTNSLS